MIFFIFFFSLHFLINIVCECGLRFSLHLFIRVPDREWQAYCKNCTMCNLHCPDYEPIVCSRRKKTAHVCNGCGFISDCNYEKTFYKASRAQQEYRTLLSESRSGIGFTEEELKSLDDRVSTLIRQGQSPHNVSVNNRDTIMVSKSTVYSIISCPPNVCPAVRNEACDDDCH
jgi:hypothetical protein